jgi:hypothetical protein
LRKILEIGEQVLPHDELDVEVEYDCCVVAQYPIASMEASDKYLDVVLSKRRTQCLAQERRKTEVSTESSCCATARASCC